MPKSEQQAYINAIVDAKDLLNWMNADLFAIAVDELEGLSDWWEWVRDTKSDV